jgi:hypothetical protein
MSGTRCEPADRVAWADGGGARPPLASRVDPPPRVAGSSAWPSPLSLFLLHSTTPIDPLDCALIEPYSSWRTMAHPWTVLFAATGFR